MHNLNQVNIYSNADDLLKKISSWPDDLISKYMAINKQPEFVYTYCSLTIPQHVEDVICNSKLWLSGIKELNDPFEFNWTTTVSSNPLDSINKAIQLGKDFPGQFGMTPYQKTLETLTLALSPNFEEKARGLKDKSELVNPGVTCFKTKPFEI